jgi:hypothetical protein
MELRNLWSSLFGSGKTDIKKEPIITEAAPSTDSTTESPQSALSIEEEIQVLAHHFGGISTGMRIEIELRELLDLCPRKRKKADSYYQLKKHLMDDYGVELIITSRTSKKKEDEV